MRPETRLESTQHDKSMQSAFIWKPNTFDEVNNIKQEPFAEYLLLLPSENTNEHSQFPKPIKLESESGEVLEIRSCFVNLKKFKQNGTETAIISIDDDESDLDDDIISVDDSENTDNTEKSNNHESVNANGTKELVVNLERVEITTQSIVFRRRAEKKLWKCSFCENRTFQTNDLLMQHFNKAHKICTKCDSCFIFTRGQVSPCNCWITKKFECMKCKKRFDNIYSFNQHIAIHFDEAKEECKLCNFRLVERRLPQHMRITHGAKTFDCDFCGYRASNLLRIRIHMKSHVKPFQCKICKKQFSEKRYFKEHQLNHKNPHPFKCSKCKNSYTRLTSLGRHMQTAHSTKRNFKCDSCKYSGKTQDDLTTHKKSHTRAFNCDLCDRVFSRSTLLKQHRILHDNPYAYQCPKCKLCFTQKKEATIHIKTRSSNCEYRIKNNLTSEQNEGIKKFIRAKGSFMNIKDEFFECDLCGKKFFGKLMLNVHLKNHRDANDEMLNTGPKRTKTN